MTGLVLASRSPRRAALLAALGVPATAVPADVDERPRAGEAPEDLVVRLAGTKADAVHRPGTVTLAGDTVVVVDGRVLGQPADRDDARRMLVTVRGAVVEVVSRLERIDARSRREGRTVRSRLHLASFDAAALEAYLATGEADDKAGALAVQGGAADLTERVEGCWSNVVGLPVCAASELLRTAGVAVPRPQRTCRGMACLPAEAGEELRPAARLRPRPA